VTVGPFEAFYQSPLQHPILLWLAAGLAGWWCAARQALRPSVHRYGLALTALSLTDAWLTSKHIYGVGALTGAPATFVPLFFVLAGDFRYLLLLGLATADGDLRWSGRAVSAAVALTLVVPILSQSIIAILPAAQSGARVLYFVYEVAFFGLTAALLAWHPGVRAAPWLRPVSRFVLLYYGLWASADALLLVTGSDLGFALRVVPNVLYYGGLIAMIGWAAATASPVARRPSVHQPGSGSGPATMPSS
jgi:hypothetical protein